MDQASLERLYLELERPIYNVVYRWLWDREEAREITQEAFVRLWRIRARVQLPTARPLLYRIAVNLAANRRRWRRLWRFATVEALGAHHAEAAAAPETLERQERERALARAMDGLGERFRRVLVLCELGGMSYAEVATVLNIPAGTVASRRNAALAKLRAALTGGEEAP
jgi:RNA polymerase sigma-70 factor (ECF subfamily)